MDNNNGRDGLDLTMSGDFLDTAQQYGATTGTAAYQKLLSDLVQKFHSPPLWGRPAEEGGTRIVSVAGCTDALGQVFGCVFEHGDTILIGESTYPGAIAQINARNLRPIRIALDGDGPIPASMRDVLAQWRAEDTPGTTDKPKLMYTVPTGHNPTGSTTTLERKQEIYKICQEYNILIFEDDPYRRLVFEEPSPSYLAIDTDGRVIRADSFSKSIAPGFRAGYITGPGPLVEKIEHSVGISTHGTSMFNQCILTTLFDQWGIDGFVERTKQTASYYENQRDTAIRVAKKWLGDLVEYDVPVAGMFLWMKIKGLEDTEELAHEHALKEGVLVVPGKYFNPVKDQKSPYIRISFSNQSEANMDKGFEALARAIKKITASR